MFETFEKPQKWVAPRWLNVSGAVLGAFSLGLSIGKLLMGARPDVDWTMTIGTLVFQVLFASICAIYAGKGDITSTRW
jgi:hypothetical protein